MEIDRPTYLIAELIGDVEPLIYRLRSQFNPERTSWPVDITIIGSSGVGTIKEGESLSKIVDRFSPIVENFGFKTVQFLSIDQFKGTGILFLKPERKAFDELHSAVAETEISFNMNRWPYNPHCTLAAVGNLDEYPSLESLVEIPQATEIKCFSLYQPEPNGGIRIHQF